LVNTALPTPRGTYLALLRHGEATGANTARTLTPHGRQQARAARRYLAELAATRIVASPTTRSLETASIVAGDRPVHSEPALDGLVVGPRDTPLSGLQEFDDVFRDPAVRPPGGESLEDLLTRVRCGIRRTLGTAGGDAIVVAHRVVNSVMLAHCLGLPLEHAGTLLQDPGAVNVLRARNGGYDTLTTNVNPLDPLRLDPSARVLPDTGTPVERRIYVVRHGEATNFGPDGRLAEHRSWLTARGRRQARMLARRFSKGEVGSVYASPYGRAVETATPIGLPVRQVAALQEISIGPEFRGRSVLDIAEEAPAFLHDPDTGLPGGETPREAGQRAFDAMQEILESDRSWSIVVVAHGGINRALLAFLLRIPLTAALSIRTDWASVNVLDLADGRWWARTLNWSPAGTGEYARAARIPGLPESHARLVGG
jgi:broad specificity phosphatase PhoE